jgi:ABC-type spermidine/putrescine transport system permease subunit I
MVVVLALFALFVCAVAGVSAWSVTVALRLGKFTNRNGIEINRREDPRIFWLSILLGFFPLALCLCIALWVAYQFRSPSHG